MNLRAVQRKWEQFARRDPLWAVLTHPDKKNNRWALDEFFQTGIAEVDELLAVARAHASVDFSGAALDFGCGVGRLSQALARHFAEVVGVDISPTMVALAQRHNRIGVKCRFVVNDRPNLKLFSDGAFGFIYSSITLQHIPLKYVESYLREFVRLLMSGGMLVFQMPSERVGSPGRLRLFIGDLYARHIYPRLHGEPSMDMFAMRPDRVAEILTSAGGEIVHSDETASAGAEYRARRYFVRRTR